MKTSLSIIAALFISLGLYAQGEMDALRFSGTDIGGTARGMAMSGAFGALGGDITGVAVNPAGIAVYRSSEVVTTLNFENVASKTDITENKFTFNFDNLAYVGYFPTGGETVKAFQVGFAYNRLKNFHRNYSAVSHGLGGSMMDYMAELANRGYNSGVEEGYLGMGGKYDPFKSESWLPTLGYNGYLIDPPKSWKDSNGNQIDSYLPILDDGELVDNDLLVEEKGSIASYDFTLGANVADWLSLGMTFSVTDMDYRMYSSYFENPQGGGEFELANWIESTGTGFGLKLGAILRPTDNLRIGLAYHSPVWYEISDNYSASLYQSGLYDKGESTPNSGHTSGADLQYRPKNYPGSETVRSGDFFYDYKLKTPHKWVFSVAGIVEDWALLSLDYEIRNYQGMDFSSASGVRADYKSDNQVIDNHYRAASTLKFGAEFRLTPQFAVRGGFAWAQSPLEKNFQEGRGIYGDTEVNIGGSIAHHLLDDDTFYYSFGFGYRFTPQFYIDIASVVKTQDSKLFAYPRVEDGNFLVASNAVSFASNTFKGLITLGYKF